MTRAERVEAALSVYVDTSGKESALVDLLADAMLEHGLEAVEQDIETARMHYSHEVGGEE